MIKRSCSLPLAIPMYIHSNTMLLIFTWGTLGQYWLRNTLCQGQENIRYFRDIYGLYDCFEDTNGNYLCIYIWPTEETTRKHEGMGPYTSSSSPNSELGSRDDVQRRRKRKREISNGAVTVWWSQLYIATGMGRYTGLSSVLSGGLSEGVPVVPAWTQAKPY